MTEEAMCRDEGCTERASVRLHGPHGVLVYCEPHARWYETVMGICGARTLRLKWPSPSTTGDLTR